MNLFKLISDIEQVDPEISERYSFYSRRNMLKFGSNLVAAGIPVLVAGSLNKALAQSGTPSAAAVAVLQFALKLEYLEDEFYRMGLAASGLVPASDRTVIEPDKQA